MDAPAAAIERAAATPHPRLIFTPDAERSLRDRLVRDERLARFEALCRSRAEELVDRPPCGRVQIGRRLLGTSREVLRRVLLLAMAARLSGDERFGDRCVAELEAVADFADWNPSHWLDVAELALAVALGYDWLYPQLSEGERAMCEEALERHAFAVYTPNEASNNWNDVCNGAMIVASLALADVHPDLGRETVAAAAARLPKALGDITPEGAHSEGGGYWNYATLFSTCTLAALESAAATDLGLLAAHPGWLASGGFYAHLHGPSGGYHNYSDPAHSGRPRLVPQLFWMAQRAGHPEWTWHQAGVLDRFLAAPERKLGRLAPLLLLWAGDGMPGDPPQALDFASDGISSIALHRTAWRDDAGWVGFKGGSPGGPHAHMDAGSFVYEVDGVRWAIDLGMQDYHELESQGIAIWPRDQDSDRWRVFRMNVSSHNTLMVDGAMQRIEGRAPLVAHGRGWSVMDLGPVYAGQLAAAQRGVHLLDDRRLLIQDEFVAAEGAHELRWAMLTGATVALDGAVATLEQDGQRLELRVLEPEGVALACFESARPPRDYDAPNPGTRLVGFHLALRPGTPQRLRVLLVPSAAAAADDPECQPLEAWPARLPAPR